MGEFEQGRNTSELRKAFEALEQVAFIIHAFTFNEIDNEYEAPSIAPDYTIGVVNGMWIMFQNQQSQIEQLQEQLDSKNTKPPLGKPFDFDLLDSYKEKIEHLKAELSQQNVQLMHARQNIKTLSSANEKLDIEREKLKLRGECE